MAQYKPQFDPLKGVTLKEPLSIGRFASARAQEIAALTQAIDDPQRTGLVFQKLPKHMRRRVMSHNSNRLPRRLKEAHMHQLRKSGLPPKPKRPSRKFRRRPKNLLLEYSRRQKNFIWLETHIWHAKRFHMVNKWGYKLADFPCDKSFRACYRATANHCLLQDISYYCCIELNGPENQLLEKLQCVTSKDCGLTFQAKAFLKGTREGSVMLFHQNSYPFGAIGRVSFLWKPSEGMKSDDKENVNEVRTLWLWAHPAFYYKVLQELTSLFHFIEENTALSNQIFPDMKDEPFSEYSSSSSDVKEVVETAFSPAKKKLRLEGKTNKKIEETKLATRNVPFVRTPKYQTSDGSIKLILLKETLNRFRLTGPLSQAVLLESLQISDVLEKEDCEMAMETSEQGNWWSEYCGSSEIHRSSLSYQKTVWAKLKGAASPAQLSPHLALALTVTDPRLQLPSKRMKAVPDDEALWEQESNEHMADLSPLAAISPIWNSHIRDEVTRSKMSTSELAALQSKNLVPESAPEELINMEGCSLDTLNISAKVKSRIPILLIQRPGSQDPIKKRLGFSSGWDIIMPAGWALPFWLGLVFRGARVGGLRESGSIEFEASCEHLFPPDSEGGCEEARNQQIHLTEKHFRLPPDKRPNYIKLGISSPFNCAWNILTNDWSQNIPMVPGLAFKAEDLSSSVTGIFVLRDRKKLEGLKITISDLKVRKLKKDYDISISEENRGLVEVAVHMCGKGSPADHAIICFPSKTDIDNICMNFNYSGPVEELHVDKYQEERKQLRVEHKKLLKCLRRKRVREKFKEEGTAQRLASQGGNDLNGVNLIPLVSKKKKNGPTETKDIVDKYAERMKSLWLPPTETVRHSCNREVIGFITKGDFCFTEAQGSGQGYIVLSALRKLISLYQERLNKGAKSIQPWVLVRNPTSLQYRFGIIQIHL